MQRVPLLHNWKQGATGEGRLGEERGATGEGRLGEERRARSEETFPSLVTRRSSPDRPSLLTRRCLKGRQRQWPSTRYQPFLSCSQRCGTHSLIPVTGRSYRPGI